MTKALWNGTIIAESEHTEMVEGNHYFPANTIKKEYFRTNKTTSVCYWKGVASYYDIVVDNQVNSGAAWYYATPKAAAANIKDHVAFWRGVSIEE
jgi:uncharacterized protein (DUF427 family)